MSKVTKEQIELFLSGHDEMKHIIKIECDYDDDMVYIIYRDDNNVKRIKKDYFYPFVWCKQNAARELFNGKRDELKKYMGSYGIGAKGLKISDGKNEPTERMENGYRIMFYAKTNMSFSKFMEFFEKGGLPIYPKPKDKNYGRKDYICVAPNEQYMIATGKRLFKGYNDYDDLVRMSWDLETEGLDPTKDHIDQIGLRTNKGFEKVIKVDHNDPQGEIKALIEFRDTIKEEKPDVICGHNTENFDWNFNDVRLQSYGSNLYDFTKDTFPKGIYKKKKQSVLKLGGEMEYYYPTCMWGTHITDSLFAVRRAQALDSNMKKADLKYVTKYSKLNKPNRVYVPGKIINKTWSDKVNKYAFNNNNGEWFKITDKLLSKKTDEQPLYTLYKDKLINNETSVEYEIVTGEYIVKRYLLDDLYETDKVELQYNQSNFLVGKMLPVSFEKMCTMGTAAIWKYIMLAWSYENDLAVPELIPSRSFTGGLSRLLSVGYIDRVVKLDYNSLYPSIILSLGIESKIDISGVMSALLEYILTQREYYKELKGEFGGKAKKTKKQIEKETETKIINELKKLLKEYEAGAARNDKMQLPLKITGNAFFGSYGSGSVFPWSDIECAEETTCSGRMMLRLMIYWFTKKGYKPIVGDTDGFNFQMPENFKYTENNPYIGKGLNRNTVEGEKYTYVEGDVAEFNDLFMRVKNGLGIDEYANATINFSRKNYADFLENGKVKLVGNTIKSKKMPLYIENFMNNAIDLLLHGKGHEFLESYYDYIEKIYNLQIPLKEIASIGKIKTSIETYKENCKQLTAGGTKKARQAWYELAIKHNLSVNMGDSIYYINTGNKKSSSDVQRITHYYIMKDGEKHEVTKEMKSLFQKEKKKNPIITQNYTEKTFAENFYKQKLIEEDELIFNCVLLSNDIVEDEENHYCSENFEYNVEKYIEMFNKRVRPLLVCFSRDIRTSINSKGKEIDNILINNPKDRKQFTEEESKLVNGEPYNITDQDTYEQLMTMEDKEIKFWLSVNKKPPYIDDCNMNWDNIKEDYLLRQKELEREEIQEEIRKYNEIIDNIKQSEVEDFINDGIIPLKILTFLEEDVHSMNFISKKYGVVIGSIFDIIDKEFNEEE